MRPIAQLAVTVGLVAFAASPTTAAIEVALDAGLVGAGRTVIVALRLDADGESVGGLQADILFDRRAVRLDSAASCRIEAALGDRLDACSEDVALAPCKTLNRHLADCGAAPTVPGCAGQPPHVGRLRAIVAATAIPNHNPIPDGVVFRCEFSLVDENRLPATLTLANTGFSDPVGTRLDGSASGPAVIAIDPTDPPPTSTVTNTIAPTATAPRTATALPTRTRTHTRTVAPTPTATPSPTPREPRALGFDCLSDQECLSTHCVDARCCEAAECDVGETCAMSRIEGQCTPLRELGADCDAHGDCASAYCDPVLRFEEVSFAGRCAPPPPPFETDGAADEPEPGHAGDDDDDGCAIVDESSPAWGLWLGLALLLMSRAMQRIRRSRDVRRS